MNNFFITLISNNSYKIYPENTQSNFTNYLQIPLSLTDDYEVGITEIFFNKIIQSPKNVKKRNVEYMKWEDGMKMITQIKKDFKLINTIHVENHEEEKVDSNKDNVNEKKTKTSTIIDKNVNPEQTMLSKPDNEEHIKSTGKPIVIQKWEPMQQTPNTFNFYQHTGNDLIANNNSNNNKTIFYIYTNIIKERAVGNQLVKALKIFISKNDAGAAIFHNIEYHPISISFIREISIKITDDVGEQLNFESSKVPLLCTLHFRKRI